MLDKKQNGSYYTPQLLTDFLIKHVFDQYNMSKNLKILEPSCGDGSFVKSILSNFKESIDYSIDLTVVEIDELELKKTSDLFNHGNNENVKYKIYNCDFLNFQKENKYKYSLIVGNPPYIKKSLMTKGQIDICKEIFDESGLSTKYIKNIWPAFLLSLVQSLEENGILCLVLPSELLQVKYSNRLRKFILSNFEKLEIFSFNELIFENVIQDIVILIGAKRVTNEKDKGIYFYQVDKLKDLSECYFTLKNANIHRTTLDKWTNYILEDQDLNFIDTLTRKLNRLEYYCDKVSVGIVTAANSYFIINDQVVRECSLQEHTQPILSNSIGLKKTLLFTRDDFNSLKSKNKNINLIRFPNIEKELLDQEAVNYIDQGELLKIDKKYKCKLRDNWFYIPSVWTSEGFFMRRSSHFPIIFVNDACINVTDCFYRINMKKEFKIRNLAFSFLNTLTLILAELEGRYYGGGVLELTPNEFKNLYLPYQENITDIQFNRLEKILRNKEPINVILDYTDELILKKNLNLNDTDIYRLRSIYKTLVERRRKNKPTLFKDCLDYDY